MPAAVLFSAGCAALPLTAVRDAALVPPGASSHSAAYAVPQLVTNTKFTPTDFGGSTLDYAYRTGVTAGVDRAVRVGVNLFPRANGFYGGVEEGRDLRKGTRAWGTVGYTGVIAGADGLWGALIPGHLWAQGYTGLVAGKISGRWRPEAGLRAGLQGGQYGYAPYGAAMVSAEPRLRIAWRRWSLAFGLGLDGGVIACNDCVFGAEGPVKGVWGIRPTLSVQAP